MTYFKLKVDGTLEISGSNGVGFESFDTLPRHDTLAPDECKYYNKETITVIGTEDVVIGQDADGVDIIEVRDVTESAWSVEIDYVAIQADEDIKVLADANNPIYAELDALDKSSIRDIREWIATQPNAPQMLIERENQAIVARGKLR